MQNVEVTRGEIFLLEAFVLWRHQRAQWEYEARSRNWIWLHKFTSYVIKTHRSTTNFNENEFPGTAFKKLHDKAYLYTAQTIIEKPFIK